MMPPPRVRWSEPSCQSTSSFVSVGRGGAHVAAQVSTINPEEAKAVYLHSREKSSGMVS